MCSTPRAPSAWLGNLINPELKPAFAQKNREEQEKMRASNTPAQRVKLISIDEARRRGPKFDWKAEEIAQPEFTGLRTLSSDPGRPGHCRSDWRIWSPCIDWSPFFHTWELRGRYPAILQHEKHGAQARELFAGRQKLLDRIVNKKLLTARGGLWIFPGQCRRRRRRALHRCLARAGVGHISFSAAADGKAGRPAQLVPGGFRGAAGGRREDYSARLPSPPGIGVDELAKKFKADHDDYNAIMAEALADRLAEAFAEYLHKRARDEWGYGRAENLTVEQLIDEQYRGIRPPRVIRPARTTRKSGRCGSCWTRKRTPGSS